MEKYDCERCGCYWEVEDRNNFDCPNCEMICEVCYKKIEKRDYWLSDTLVCGECYDDEITKAEILLGDTNETRL